MSKIKIKCNVCKNDYNDSTNLPRILLCGHTFCTVCIENIIKTENISSCPSCDNEITIKSIEELCVNHDLLDISQYFATANKRESQIDLNDLTGRTKYLVNLLQRKSGELENKVKEYDHEIYCLQDQVKTIEEKKSVLTTKVKEINNLIENLEELKTNLDENGLESVEKALEFAEQYIGKEYIEKSSGYNSLNVSYFSC